MARGKKGRKTAATAQINKEAQSIKPEKKPEKRTNRFYIWDYIVVCVFFILFCYLQKYVALKLLGEEQIVKWSLNFFFDTLWKGFVIVAVLVGLHDFLYQDTENDTA